jgi:hypothetical protein
MWKSVFARVDYQLATKYHQLREQQIPRILAAKEALVDWAETVSTTKHRQYRVHLNRAQHAATTWSDAERRMAIEHLEHEIHPVIYVKCKHFSKLFQHHEQQPIQEVGTKGIGSQSLSAK